MSKVRDIVDNLEGASTSPVVTNADTDVNATAGKIPVRDTDTALSGKNQCTAWVNFNGTNGTIRDSYNVSSVVRDANGKYTISFTNAMANANYVITGTAGDFQGAGRGSTRLISNLGTTGFMDINGFNIVIQQSSDNTLNDIEQVFLQVFGGK